MAQPLQTMFNFILLSSVVTLTGVTGLGEMVIGDIQLVPDSTNEGYYQPLVYYTNGIEPLQLGGICFDNIGKIQATVICNQLGYELYDFMGVTAVNNSYPIWLSGVKCKDQQVQHILSCDYNVTFGNQTTKQWPCKTNLHLILKCDWNKPLIVGTYDGYISLCPPDNSNTAKSKSFGLIAIYLSQHDSWRGLNQPNNSKTLGVNEANAICQQLGYTMAVPGSAVILRAVQTQYTFQHCYDNEPPYRVQKQAWMQANEVNCSGPKTCFSCCYDYPPTPQCEYCDQLNDLVLQCTFVPDHAAISSGRGGAKNECVYHNAECKSNICASSTATPSICAGIAVPIGIVTTALAALIASYVTWRRLRQIRQHDYQHQQDGHIGGERHQGGRDQDGGEDQGGGRNEQLPLLQQNFENH